MYILYFRSEREKSLLQDQIKSLEKSRTHTIPTSSVVPSQDNWVSPDEAFALKSQIFNLNNEVNIQCCMYVYTCTYIECYMS